MTEAVIHMEHVAVQIGKQEILHDISLNIESGCIVSVIGPNGCGKSTLLKVMSRMLPGSTGNVYIGGRDICSFGRKELAREMAVLTQIHHIPDDVTVRELVRMGRFPYRTFYTIASAADRIYVEKAISAVRLQHCADQLVKTLSGGEQQRAWLALTLAQRPKILLLDEPTTYLDIRHQLHMMNVLRHCKDKLHLTIVIVLHDINQALQFTDAVIVMKNGRIIQTGRPQEVITERVVKEVFGVRAEMCRTSEGKPTILPVGIYQTEEQP